MEPQPVTDQPSISPVAPTTKPKNRIVFFIGGILILGLGFTIGLLFNKNPSPTSQISPTPTPLPAEASAKEGDPTANWKTYSDNKFGFSFAYPNDATIRMYENGVINFLDNQGNTKFNFSGFQILSPLEYQQYQNQTKILDQKTYIDAQKRTWSTDMGLGEVFNFTGVLNQKDKYIIVSLQSGFSENQDNGNSFRTLANQILSTFKFTGTTPTVTPATNKNVTNFNYKLPDGWKTVQDETGSFEVGYDPNATTTSLTYSPGAISIFIKGNIGGAAMSVHLKNYDGGSRHQFIYKYTSDNQPPQKQDLGSDYNEKEYFYNNKSCLFLRGIYTSQFPNIWGMCDAGNDKAFLITSYVPDYETVLQTIRLLK